MNNLICKTILALVTLIVIITLSACSPIVFDEQAVVDDFAKLDYENTLGQSFIAKYGGLNQVQIKVNPQDATQGRLIVSLYEGYVTDHVLISRNSIPLTKFANRQEYDFHFPTQLHSTNNLYYLDLAITGEGALKVGSAYGPTYSDGSLYLNQNPKDGQLSFQLGYSGIYLFVGLLKELIKWAIILLSFSWLVILPGWAISTTIIPNWSKIHWAVKGSIAAGIMISLYPLLFLWGDLLGINFSSAISWIVPFCGLVLIIWKYFLHAQHTQTKSCLTIFVYNKKKFQTWISTPGKWVPDVILIFSLILIFLSRFWAIRNLVAPMWGDSYQHAVISQLILDSGGLFSRWEPYAPYQSLSIQFGFSVLTSLYSWLIGNNVVEATLITGQLLNFFSIFTLVALASKVDPKNRWIFPAVVIIAGLVSTMPAYYVNWGRYAQLSGLVILMIALWLFWDIYESSFTRYREHHQSSLETILAGAVLSGMVLAYYRMAFYYAFFCIAYIFLTTIIRKPNIKEFIYGVWQVLIIAIIAFILFVPWIPKISGSSLASALEYGISSSIPYVTVLNDLQIWFDTLYYFPTILGIIVTLAILWALIERKFIIFVFPIWYILLVLFIVSQLINLPGANMMQSFTILISLYIPASLISGWLFGNIVQKLNRHGSIIGTIILGSISIIIVVLGTWKQFSISNPKQHALVYSADLKAMHWITDHIPENALFLVEGFSIYNGTSIVGSDAGWWIPLLTTRKNTMPPQYALLNEKPDPPEYSSQVTNIVNILESNSIRTEAAVQTLCEAGISHIYIGQTQGTTGTGAKQLFSVNDFRNNPDFDLVYSQDRVRIYSLLKTTCMHD